MCSNAFIETYFRGTPHSPTGACIVETGIAVAHNGKVPRTDVAGGYARGDRRAPHHSEQLHTTHRLRGVVAPRSVLFPAGPKML